MSQLGMKPIIILKQEIPGNRGRDTLSSSITPTKTVGTAVRSTPGPKGMGCMPKGMRDDLSMQHTGNRDRAGWGSI